MWVSWCGVVCKWSVGCAGDVGPGVVVGVVWSVDPYVVAFGVSVVGPYAFGFEAVVCAAEAGEVVACGQAAAVGVVVVERDDVVEVGFVRGGLASGEDAGAVASVAEVGQGL